jgi:hypothetical protein
VVKEGRIASTFNRGSWSAEAIMSAATGTRDAA